MDRGVEQQLFSNSTSLVQPSHCQLTLLHIHTCAAQTAGWHAGSNSATSYPLPILRITSSDNASHYAFAQNVWEKKPSMHEAILLQKAFDR